MQEELVIGILTGAAVLMIGGALLLIRFSRRAPLEARLREISGGGPTSLSAQSPSSSLAGVLQQMGSSVGGTPSKSLRQELAAAGFHSAAAPTIYLGIKLILFLIGLPLFTAAVTLLNMPFGTVMLLAIVVLATLFFLPNLYVRVCRERRRFEVQQHLPDAVDLLEIAVSAGMGLDHAWNSVASEVRGVCPVLADEMALTNLEIQLGSSRITALRHMADRTGSPDLGPLVAILVQSDRFGTSVASALQTFAGSLRETRSLRAQESAEKMAVKLIIPMVLFVFPPVLIIMAGPAFLTLVKIFSAK